MTRAAWVMPTCALGRGSITTFNASGAGTLAGQGTFGAAINAPGDVAGYYTDADNVIHGFLWKP